MMIPVIAIVGRPNVGKSTLFNCLTKTRDAIVADVPGVTRDRQYGQGKVGKKPFVLIDTGGLEAQQTIANLITGSAKAAIGEADSVLFLVDGRSGVNVQDENIAKMLRRCNKPVWLVVNKTDGLDPVVAKSDFYRLGFKEPITIAASQSRGVTALIEAVLENLRNGEQVTKFSEEAGIRFALIGRPNVGKSTLANRMLGEKRVLVFDAPGTTRDSIFVAFKYHNQQYTLIDTAGIRRRSRITEVVEKFSVVKSMQAIEAAHVVIFMIDATEGVTEQDLRLIGHILKAGRGLVIVINKWDGVTLDQKEAVKSKLYSRLTFTDFARRHFISALHGMGVKDLFQSINEAYHSATCSLATNKLTEILFAATQAHEPPVVRGHRIKLRYAHQGGRNPQRIVIHGTQAQLVSENYRRYLRNFFHKKLELIGAPIRLIFKGRMT